MIDMALLSVIRRWTFRDQVSIRAIARRTGLSRNTIRKYLRSGAVEPKFKVPERPSKLDAFADKLAQWLKVEAGKSRKQKRTVKRLYADLVALGYQGSYGRVAAFAGIGRLNGIGNSRPAAAARLYRWLFRLARPFSLTGARTGPSWAGNGPGYRSHTSSLSAVSNRETERLH